MNMPQTDLSPIVRPSEEVAAALADGAPVVSLESTVYSNLGLPSPQNETALHRCITAIREAGAVPAVTAVLDGELRAGLEDSEYCLLYTSPSPRDRQKSRMPSSA